ncbi:MAG: exonuclease SbcCD subunit D [Treponema sp.]|nr:exonuclease SbcCD subunit D [Treponema sp.]
MKFLHISDLHFGKKLNEFSLIEDQQFIVYKILQAIDELKPDAVLIAGDIYDKGIPTIEAVKLFDTFLCRLAERKLEVFIISGNHDSPERMTCGASLMETSGIHFSRVYDGTVCKYELSDKNGPVNIYLLPYIKPAIVKAALEAQGKADEAEKITSYDSAVEAAISQMKVDWSQRNVLIAHQFVTGSARCDSEDISVGGSDNISAELFSKFDYVALGHLHGMQKAGGENIRYSGSPLKYSFSEVNHKKGGLMVELEEKGSLKVKPVLFVPQHDLRCIKGTYEELTLKKYWEQMGDSINEYLHITLTDEEEIPEGFARLQLIYKNLVSLQYDNSRTQKDNKIEALSQIENISPLDLFERFYELQNNQKFSIEQRKFAQELIEDIWGGKK